MYCVSVTDNFVANFGRRRPPGRPARPFRALRVYVGCCGGTAGVLPPRGVHRRVHFVINQYDAGADVKTVGYTRTKQQPTRANSRLCCSQRLCSVELAGPVFADPIQPVEKRQILPSPLLQRTACDAPTSKSSPDGTSLPYSDERPGFCLR